MPFMLPSPIIMGFIIGICDSMVIAFLGSNTRVLSSTISALSSPISCSLVGRYLDVSTRCSSSLMPAASAALSRESATSAARRAASRASSATFSACFWALLLSSNSSSNLCRSSRSERTSDTSRLSCVSARRARLAADDVCLMDWKLSSLSLSGISSRLLLLL